MDGGAGALSAGALKWCGFAITARGPAVVSSRCMCTRVCGVGGIAGRGPISSGDGDEGGSDGGGSDGGGSDGSGT